MITKPTLKKYNYLKSLEYWITEHVDKNLHSEVASIDTLDNPGWSLFINLSATKYAHSQVERILIERNENDWLSYEVKDNEFRSFGGPFNLVELFQVFFQLFPSTSLIETNHSTLEFLQKWFKSQCNGDWEHCYDVSIIVMKEKCDVQISLNETFWENITLPSIKYANDDDWFICEVKDSKFIAFGTLNSLEQIISYFHEWINSDEFNIK